MATKMTRREFLRVSGIGLGALALASCKSVVTPTEVDTTVEEPVPPEQIVEPTTVEVTELTTKYKERPEFAARVASGELPPVDERLPVNPMVMENTEIGTYGGEFRSSGNPFSHAWEIYAFMANNEATKFMPEYAESYEFSEDLKLYTMHIRKGIKWSDGTPMTSEDFTFYYNDCALNTDLNPAGPPAWGAKPTSVTAIDEFTVQYTFDKPNHPWIHLMCYWPTNYGLLYYPSHYLKQFHIKYNPDAETQAIDEGFETWAQLFNAHRNDGRRNDVPAGTELGPWVVKTWETDTHAWEANPYYMAVDTHGNQLPYITSVISAEGTNREVASARVLSGESHWMGAIPMSDINLYRESADKGDFRVIIMRNSIASTDTIGLNQTSKDPVKRELFQDVRFRQALSLAINRDEINDKVYFGSGTPQQVTVSPSVGFYKPEWAQAYAQFDPDQANRLLDEIGMEWDANHEWRLAPDGSEFQLNMQRDDRDSQIPIADTELIAEHWKAVGINTIVKLLGGGLYWQAMNGNDLDFGVWYADRIEPIRCDLPNMTKWNPREACAWSIPWGTWRDTNGAQGEEPPEKYKQQFALEAEWQNVTNENDYNKIGAQLWDFWSKDLTIFGAVGYPNSVFVLSNEVANGPQNGMWYGDGMAYTKSYYPATWFFRS